MLQRKLSGGHLDASYTLPFDAVPSSPKAGSKRRFPGGQTETNNMPLVLSVMVFFCIAAGGYFCLESTLQNDLGPRDFLNGKYNSDKANLASLVEDLHAENSELYSEISMLRRQLATLQQEKKNKRDDPSQLGYKVQSHRLMQDKQRLQEAVQDMSNRHLREKFGSGPYYVEVALDAVLKEGHGITSENDSLDRLIIELSSDSMPHSSDWFLDKVDKQLFDGIGFSQTNTGELALAVASRLNGDSFPQLVFDEQHTEEQRPAPYAVSLRSGAGGMTFYVNTGNVDASLQSNQGGDDSPSFAKVVEGFNVVDRMVEGNGNTTQGSVSIRSMRVLSSYEPNLLI